MKENAMKTRTPKTTISLAALALSGLASVGVVAPVTAATASQPSAPDSARSPRVTYQTTSIDGLDIAYREAGPKDAPTIVLLHGFPTSSHMFRDLIPQLADSYRVIAPDFPGFGLSSAPSVDEWDYTFDNIANVVDTLLEQVGADSYTLFVMDYGAPVGFRIATEHPERVEGFIVQNGNAYDEGLKEFWDPIKAYWDEQSDENADVLRGFFKADVTKWQYTHGTRNPESISPDNWLVDQPLLDRPGNNDVQLKLFLDYGTNPPLYPSWQQYFREHQPPMLITWGKNDYIFPDSGAYPYLRDLPDAELHVLNTGHFALEEDGDTIAYLIRDFMTRLVVK